MIHPIFQSTDKLSEGNYKKMLAVDDKKNRMLTRGGVDPKMVEKVANPDSIYQAVAIQSKDDALKRTAEDQATMTQQTAFPQQGHSKEKVQELVENMNQFLTSSNTHLKFVFHDQLKEYYVTIVNDETDEVIKEIPPKKLLDIYAAMANYLGILVDKKI
jgi:flagellar protein FlaG